MLVQFLLTWLFWSVAGLTVLKVWSENERLCAATEEDEVQDDLGIWYDDPNFDGDWPVDPVSTDDPNYYGSSA